MTVVTSLGQPPLDEVFGASQVTGGQPYPGVVWIDEATTPKNWDLDSWGGGLLDEVVSEQGAPSTSSGVLVPILDSFLFFPHLFASWLSKVVASPRDISLGMRSPVTGVS